MWSNEIEREWMIFMVHEWEQTIFTVCKQEQMGLVSTYFHDLMRNHRYDWEMTEKWLRNDWEMTEKYLRNDWEMTEKWLRNDWEMTAKWLRNDRINVNELENITHDN